MVPFLFNFYEIQPALRIIARDKKITKKVQVILFKEASALLALLNIELPLAAIPPMRMGGIAASGSSMFNSASSAEASLNKITWTFLVIFLSLAIILSAGWIS